MGYEQKILELNKPLEINRFRIFVPDGGYQWMEDAQPSLGWGEKNALDLGSPPYQVDYGFESRSRYQQRSHGEGGREYEPLVDEPGLFKRFMQLELDRDKILAFANEYGWIGPRGYVGCGENPAVPAVGFGIWADQIQSMLLAQRLISFARAGDQQALRRYFFWHPSKPDIRVGIQMEGRNMRSLATISDYDPAHNTWNGWLASSLHPHTDDLAQFGWKRGDHVIPAMEFAAQIVNFRLTEFCHPILAADRSRTFNGYWTAKNLLGCLWLQFYLNVTGQMKLRRCTICKKWMDVTESRSTRKMHVRCSRNERQAKWRRKNAT